jgi:phosphotransferase system  glucose/maltose/N-acetylglucosamine-specific IIC component
MQARRWRTSHRRRRTSHMVWRWRPCWPRESSRAAGLHSKTAKALSTRPISSTKATLSHATRVLPAGMPAILSITIAVQFGRFKDDFLSLVVAIAIFTKIVVRELKMSKDKEQESCQRRERIKIVVHFYYTQRTLVEWYRVPMIGVERQLSQV